MLLDVVKDGSSAGHTAPTAAIAGGVGGLVLVLAIVAVALRRRRGPPSATKVDVTRPGASTGGMYTNPAYLSPVLTEAPPNSAMAANAAGAAASAMYASVGMGSAHRYATPHAGSDAAYEEPGRPHYPRGYEVPASALRGSGDGNTGGDGNYAGLRGPHRVYATGKAPAPSRSSTGDQGDYAELVGPHQIYATAATAAATAAPTYHPLGANDDYIELETSDEGGTVAAGDGPYIQVKRSVARDTNA